MKSCKNSSLGTNISWIQYGKTSARLFKDHWYSESTWRNFQWLQRYPQIHMSKFQNNHTKLQEEPCIDNWPISCCQHSWTCSFIPGLCVCRYGDCHPVFYIGSLEDAIKDALQTKAVDVSTQLSAMNQEYEVIHLMNMDWCWIIINEIPRITPYSNFHGYVKH